MGLQSLFFIVPLSCLFWTCQAQTIETIHIAGIFDTFNVEGGKELFEFTMRNIQLRSEWLRDLVPAINQIPEGTQFSFRVRNGDCDPTTTVRNYWDLRTSEAPPHGLIGCYCSGTSMSLARIAGLEAVPQISPFSTSSQLSDESEFPYFARLLAPDDERGEVGALVAMLRLYGWDRISILATDTQYAKDWVKEFRRIWEGEHESDDPAWIGEVAYSNTIGIQLDGNLDEESVKQALREVPTDNPEINSRIILLAAHSQHAFPILELARNEAFQPDSIWVGPSSWTGFNLKPEDMIWMPEYPGYLGAVPSQGGLTTTHSIFLTQMREEQEGISDGSWNQLPNFGAQLVDSILTMTIALSSLPYPDRRNGDLVMSRIKALEFEGLSGTVHFTESGDLKDPQYSIQQLSSVSSQWVPVGATGTKIGSSRATDDVCFPEVGCLSPDAKNFPDDSYPIPREKLPTWATVIIIVFLVLLLAMVLKYWRSRKSKAAIKKELEAFIDSIVGMRTAGTNYIPLLSSVPLQSDVEQPLEITTQPRVQWCWKETRHAMHKHGKETIEGDPSDCWIKYTAASNSKLEAAYQTQNGMGFYEPTPEYQVSFDDMVQTKLKTGYQRSVKRMEESSQSVPYDPQTLCLDDVQIGGNLPSDLKGEPQMVLVKGDIIQISKQHQGGWAFGTKLHEEDPAMARALVSFVMGHTTEDEPSVFADTGWFALDATSVPSAEELSILQQNVGDTGALEAPSYWDPVKDPTVVQQHVLRKGDPEYDTVVQSFMSTMQNRKIKIGRVDRIQNLAMWQSYVVKRQTICYRESQIQRGEGKVELEADAQRKAIARFERCWLWHGTNEEVKDKILQQGFNRSFCGKNATMYGKGVYFARDASYSSYKTYAVPDSRGWQYIMACRVVVGEYCRGKQDALTPDIRHAKTQSLYDSTVGLLSQDTMENPSIYVTYHDSQAYPEYLIKFRQE